MPAYTQSREYFNIFTKGTILRILPWHLRSLVSFRISSNLYIINLIKIDDEPGLLKYPRIFILARQLRTSGLKELALKRFKSQLRGEWRVENLVYYIEEIYEYQKSNEHCLPLRLIVAEAALVYYLKRLVTSVFVKVLREIKDFRVDLTNLLAKG